MSKIKIGVVEDELIVAHDICAILTETGYECSEPCVDYEEAISMISRFRPDLVLLDIMLSAPRDGVDVARHIRAATDIPLLFLTANSDPATVARAKETLPDAFLLKPFQKANLYSAIEVAIYAYEKRKAHAARHHPPAGLLRNAVFVQVGSHFQKLSYDEIVFLSTSQNYVVIHTQAKKYLVRATLSDYMLQLPPSRMVRIHRSYAVNIEKVDQVHASYVIAGNNEIPFSKAYESQLLRLLNIG